MNLLVVSQHYYPERFSVTDICRGLVDRGHTVTVLTGLPNYPDGVVPEEYRHGKRRDESVDGVRVLRAEIIPRGKSKLKLGVNYLSFAESGTRLALSLNESFDRVLCYQTSPALMARPAIAYCKKHGVPLTLYCLDIWPDCLSARGFAHGSAFYKYIGRLSTEIYSAADELFASSPAFIPKLRRMNARAPIKLLYQFSNEKRAPKRESDGVFRLLFAGNIGRVQGVETIVRAAARLNGRKDIHITIAGDGSAYADCLRLKDELRAECVEFTGGVPSERMPELYAENDAFLLTYAENPLTELYFPAKLSSYAAAGKPVIAACNGVSRGIIDENRLGITCAAGDDAALSALIATVADDRGVLDGCAERARAFYEANLTEERFFDILGYEDVKEKIPIENG